MSLIPPGTAPSYDIGLYASVQVAVTCAALYDHALSFGREIELIWMKSLSLITVLYGIERYLGDIVLIMFFGAQIRGGIRLFRFRAWGALVYSWATQATMQLRIYALYRRSKRTLVLLLVSFLCEIAMIVFIIRRTIGPHSPLKATTNSVPKEHVCTFSGISPNFTYIFVPFLCFESLLFFLAARVFVENIRQDREASEDKLLGTNPFMSILARDSLSYFFVNLVACGVVMALWRGVTELYANICIPFVMLLEVLVGTRLILDFRERYARPDDSIPARSSSLYFRGDDIQMNTIRISVQCDIETIVVSDV